MEDSKHQRRFNELSLALEGIYVARFGAGNALAMVAIAHFLQWQMEDTTQIQTKNNPSPATLLAESSTNVKITERGTR